MLAFLLDCFLVGIVISVIGPIAFSFTDGRIQIGGVGLASMSCAGVSTIPAGLDPSPPDGSNHAEVCTAGALPFSVSERFLVVGRRTVNSGVTEDVSRSYMLSPAGQPIAATDLTWIAQLGFIAYIVASLLARGRTLGMRLLRIRLLVPPAETASAGVPLSRLAVRIAVAVAGYIPAALALLWILLTPDRAPVAALIIAAIVTAFAWVGYNLVLIAGRNDPVYDSVAGLAVLVDQS